MKKIGLIVIITFLSLLIVGCGCTKKTENNDSKKTNPEINVSGIVLPDKTFDGLKATDANIVYKDGISTLVAIITNTGKNLNVEMIDIVLKDKNGTILLETKGYIGKTLANNESKTITTSATKDLTKVTDVEYKLQ